MGYWFGKHSKCSPWRKTPTKIGNKWYTPKGEPIRDPEAYFSTVEQNGRYWNSNTGYKRRRNRCSHE